MAGLPRAWAMLALAGASACLDVPPYRPCGAGDVDCDGWPATALQPAAEDCDDGDPTVNPAAADDPTTAIIEDCFDVALGTTLPAVAPTPRGWLAGDVNLEFDSSSRMPSSLRVGGTEVFAGNTDTCIRDERMAGVSLYPAFGVDHQSVQTGQALTVRGGPAAATTRVTWTQQLPMAATTFGCDAATTVTGTIDFTVQPNGRIVRSDAVEVSAAVTTCAGCANPGGGPPLLTSYATFVSALDRYQLEPAVSSTTFPGAGMAATALPAPAAPIVGCISGPNAALPKVGLAWWFPTPIAGMRARTTSEGRVNHAIVVDWINSAAVADGTYRLVTALAPGLAGGVDCAGAVRTAMAEFARPPTLTPTAFVPERGAYRFTGEEGAGVTITASQGIEAGAVIEIPNASERGLTVWRRTDGRYQRLRRGRDYLLQTDADRTGVVYLPVVPSNSELTFAGPGGEPPS